MKILYTILLSFLSCTTQAQELSVINTLFVGGDSMCGGSDEWYSIATGDGGLLVVGETTCYNGGGDIPPNFADTADPYAGNVLVCKLDSNMQVSWTRVYGGTDVDYAESAVQTPDGGYGVLCYTISNNIDVSGNHSMPGSGDLWLIRLDDSGRLQWQRCYGSPADEQPGAISNSPDGGFVFYGISNGSGDDVPTHYSGSYFDYDWFVVKTDSAGNLQWSRSIGGTGDENAPGNILPIDNGYYLVSSSNSTDYDCTDTIWHAGGGYTENNYYIFKLDTAAGSILWDSSYGGPANDEVAQAIFDNRDSSIVICGYTTDSGYMVSSYYGQADMWVVKANKNGVFQWGKSLGGTQLDIGEGLTEVPDGYAIYGSTFVGDVGEQDAWVFIIDDTGKEIANKQFGGVDYEWIYPSVTPYRNGLLAAGTSSSSGFTEGTNGGFTQSPYANIFVSYLAYWPLSAGNVQKQESMLILYPDPASGYINISVPAGTGRLEIMDSYGRTHFSVATGGNTVNVPLSGWMNGLYIVKWLSGGGEQWTGKFIIN